MAKEWNVQDNRTKGEFCGDIWGMLRMRIRSDADGSCAIESREFWPQNGVWFSNSISLLGPNPEVRAHCGEV